MTISREDLRDVKNDILTFMGERCDGIDGRLDKVNGRLDAQGRQITEHVAEIARLRQQATNLDREVFGRRRTDRQEAAQGALTVSLSERTLKTLANPKSLGYLLAGIWAAMEALTHTREAIVTFLK